MTIRTLRRVPGRLKPAVVEPDRPQEQGSAAVKAGRAYGVGYIWLPSHHAAFLRRSDRCVTCAPEDR